MQITDFPYLCQFYILVKIKTWEFGPILELVPILELEPPSNLAKKIRARALNTTNTVYIFYFW